jgi:hypothetical protein
MKARIDGYEIECTPEEFQVLIGRVQSKVLPEIDIRGVVDRAFDKVLSENKPKMPPKLGKGKVWSVGDTTFCKEKYLEGWTYSKIGSYLNRTEGAVRCHLSKIKQYKNEPKVIRSRNDSNNRYWKHWDERELGFLHNNPDWSAKEIGMVLGRKASSIRAKRWSLANKGVDSPSINSFSGSDKRWEWSQKRAKFLMGKYGYDYEKAMGMAHSEWDGKVFIKVKPKELSLPKVVRLNDEQRKRLFEALKNMVDRAGHLNSTWAELELGSPDAWVSIFEDVLYRASAWAKVLGIRSKDLKFSTKELIISYGGGFDG